MDLDYSIIRLSHFKDLSLKESQTIDPSVLSILKDSFFDINLFLWTYLNHLDNGILIKMSASWSSFSSDQKKIFCQDLYNRFVLYGFGDIQILDSTGSLIAKKSQFGNELVLYEQNF